MERTIPISRALGSVTALERHAEVIAAAIPVVIAHREGLGRAGMRALLDRETDVRVLGEAASGEELIALTTELRPDVIVLDLGLPGLDALEATRRILTAPGRLAPKVVIVGKAGSDEELFGALHAGASAFLVRESEPVELLRAIRSAAVGHALLSPCATRRLIDEFGSQPDPRRPVPERLDELTARERQVMGLVAMGLTNDEIAERLVVSPATAKTHVSRAMLKLHARDRAHLVMLAYQTRLVEPRRGDGDRPRLALAVA